MQPVGTMNQTQTLQREATVRVALAEGSNATTQYYTFTPQTVEINTGESVTWFSRAQLSDIHTVTFALDPNARSDIILPFAVSGTSSDFRLLPPFNGGEPVMMQSPEGGQAFLAVNKCAFYPTILASNNQTTYLNGTDIEYTMNGNERVINSGIIQPPVPPTTGTSNENSTAAEEAGPSSTGPPPFPIISSFTVRFEQPGTYPYFCAIHPWMQGKVKYMEEPRIRQGQKEQIKPSHRKEGHGAQALAPMS
jgi:plastocyanin